MPQNQPPQLALVTGAASGLGREFARELAARGMHVVAADIDLAGAQETQRCIQTAGGSARAVQLDVTSFAEWQALIQNLRGEFPRLSWLVNNAGICGAACVGEGNLDDVNRILQVNLQGVIHGCHAAVPWFRETAPGGSIVNIASIAAVLNAPAMSAYSMSKAGVLSLSETLHSELCTHGIGVTVVLPGFFASKLLSQGKFTEPFYRQIAEQYVRSASFTASDVVEQTLQAADRGKLYAVMGRRARLAWRLRRLAPVTFQRIVAWKYDRDRRQAGQQ